MPSSAPVRSTLRPRRACTAAWSCGRTCRGPGRLRTSDPRRGRPADRLGGAGPGGAPPSRVCRASTPERLGTGALSPRETERRRKTWGSGHAAGCGDRLRPSARRPVGDPRQSRQRAHVLPGRGDPGGCRHSVDGSALTLRGPLGADPRRTGPRVLSSGCGSIVRPGLAPGTGLERGDQLSRWVAQPPTRGRSTDGPRPVRDDTAEHPLCTRRWRGRPGAGDKGRGGSALGKAACPPLRGRAAH